MMSSRISAILGPTNTGKTYSAIEKLLNHKNGVIGFPLRLLARENFEYAKSKLDLDSIALVTGEEKIIPENAKYFFSAQSSQFLTMNLILLLLMRFNLQQILREVIFLQKKF